MKKAIIAVIIILIVILGVFYFTRKTTQAPTDNTDIEQGSQYR